MNSLFAELLLSISTNLTNSKWGKINWELFKEDSITWCCDCVATKSKWAFKHVWYLPKTYPKLSQTTCIDVDEHVDEEVTNASISASRNLCLSTLYKTTFWDNACLKVHGWEWLGCHAGHQEISRCHTRGESDESIVCRWWSEEIHPGFEIQGRCHQKSKQGISGPTKRTDVLQIFFFF